MQYIGLVAACLTTISFLPQVIQVIRTKNTASISLGMYLLFVLGVFLWSIYGFYIRDIAIILANGITLISASVILYHKFVYG
ncbi:SemiSWEET transporter [Enterococcus sp.]|uniref:SemiSWEET transporter n=1 Tax=Enterococcus sp. TaxID=35783 RepID=UPI002FCB1DDC